MQRAHATGELDTLFGAAPLRAQDFNHADFAGRAHVGAPTGRPIEIFYFDDAHHLVLRCRRLA